MAVTVHGRASAVLLAVVDLERLEETVAILSGPATMRRLAESDAELARVDVVLVSPDAGPPRQPCLRCVVHKRAR